MCSFTSLLSCRLAGCYGCSPTQTTLSYRSSSRSGVLWGLYHSGYRNWCILYLLVCGQVDVSCCVLLFVPFGPWLSDKGCKKLKPKPTAASGATPPGCSVRGVCATAVSGATPPGSSVRCVCATAASGATPPGCSDRCVCATAPGATPPGCSDRVSWTCYS